MKQFLFFIWVFFALLLTSTARAQTTAQSFPTGEKLTYNLSFATFNDAGTIELYAAGRERLTERDVNVIRAKVRTTGIVQSTLIDLNDDLTTYIDPETNLPIRAERILYNDGKKSEARRDFPENQLVNQLASPSVPDTNVYDLLSAIYQIRRLDFNNTAIQSLKIWESEKFYNAKLQVTGRENVSTSIGANNAFVIQISGDDKVFNRYKAKIYISDDERHLPVLISLKLPQGELRAELVSVEILQTEPLVAVVIQPTPEPTPVGIPTPRPPRVQPTPKPYFDNQPLDADLPFALGEKLDFEVLRAGQKIGNVRFEVRERKQFAGRDSVQLAVTAQPVNNSNVFTAGDKMESYIDPNYLVPFRHEIKLGGGLANFNQSLSFDQERGAVTNERGVEVGIPIGTFDALSFVYALRAFRFSLVQKDAADTRAAVFLSGAPIIVTLKPRREIIEFGGKKLNVIALRIITDNPQIDSLGLSLWLSDDARRLPLKFICNTPLGAVQANLIKF
ncbi:MAG: DUF3108 domain-containing protein [Pyrinomonadaceae bacterium]